MVVVTGGRGGRCVRVGSTFDGHPPASCIDAPAEVDDAVRESCSGALNEARHVLRKDTVHAFLLDLAVKIAQEVGVSLLIAQDAVVLLLGQRCRCVSGGFQMVAIRSDGCVAACKLNPSSLRLQFITAQMQAWLCMMCPPGA